MKPWLFLDVDGVVSPIPPDDHKGNPVPPPGYWTYEGAPWRMYFPDGLVAWLWDLDRSFDVRWLTSWEDGILKVAQRIGAPTWDWLPLGPWTARGSRVSRKAAPIVGLISHDLRPLAWVDDHHRAVGWVPERLADVAGGLPTLILKPRTNVGLTSRHCDMLRAFALDPAATVTAIARGAVARRRARR